MCGEKGPLVYRHKLATELPPLVWGKDSVKASLEFTNRVTPRITPTYVGKNVWSIHDLITSESYPHFRGEKLMLIMVPALGQELPPLA